MEERPTLMVEGPPAPSPPAGLGDGSSVLLEAVAPHALGAESSAELPLPSELMGRFEELSRVFKREVEGLIDQEHAASHETVEQLKERIGDLERQLDVHANEARYGAASVRAYLGQHKD